MSVHLTENQKHVRRRLEPLRMPAESTVVQYGKGSARIRTSVVEAFGVRYRGGTLVDSGMDWTCGGKKPYLANRFVEEIVRLSQLRHPNLAAFYGVATDALSLTIAADVPAPSLDELLRRYETVPEFVKVSVLLDAARGLLYLHRQKPAVAHTRLSTHAIYVSPSMSAKLGDVGVAGLLCGAGGRSSATSGGGDGRMPPQALVDILETGNRGWSDVQVDLPAFGNVVVHTACQKAWLDPPGHTSLSPHLHTMSTLRHPLYSLAYHCLLGGVHISPHQQVPRVDIDYTVRFLRHAASNNPPPFPNTLELYHSLVQVERGSTEPTGTPSSLPHESGIMVHNGGHIPPSGGGRKICNEMSRTRNHFSEASTSSKSLFDQDAPKNTATNDPLHSSSSFSDTVHRAALPTLVDDRRNSTGQIKPPPPKPPQRTSSFRRKPMSEKSENSLSLQRTGSLRVRSQPPEETATAPLHPLQQTNSVIKSTAGAVSGGGGTKQNPLLLPSKFIYDMKQLSRGHQSEQHTSSNSVPSVSIQVAPSHKGPPPNTSHSSAEFESLLARQREKVEAEEGGRSSSWLAPPTSGPPLNSHLIPDGVRPVTDLDLPKKKAPPPPRRSSSFRSRKKYEEDSSDSRSSDVVLRRNGLPRQWAVDSHAGEQSPPSTSPSTGEQSPPSTSPSTGQSRPSSAEYQLRRMSGADLSETIFS